MTRQLGVSDAGAAISVSERLGLRFEVETERPREDWSPPQVSTL